MIRLIKLIAATAVSFQIIATTAARADEKAPPLTNQQALTLLVALRSLDGHTVVVQGNPILIPWEFKNGKLRNDIRRNQMMLEPIEAAVQKSQSDIIREVLDKMVDKDGKKATKIEVGTPQHAEVQRQIEALLLSPVGSNVTLFRIKISDLKLDDNDIPVSVIRGLEPILDDPGAGK